MPDEIEDDQPTDDEIIKEIEADNEKDYLKGLKAKNKGYLVEKLTAIEKERIASHIYNLHEDVKSKQNEIISRCETDDDVCAMKRMAVPGDDGTMPNYRTPITAVTLEVIIANIINVFFTPKEIMRVVPTEESDIPRTKKVSVFGNWSLENELDIFSGLNRLWHSSGKHGESPWLLHWVKEYGTEIKKVPLMNPANPTEPLIDPDTQQVVFQEIEEQKLLYNGPKFVVFSRKDYVQPLNASQDRLPEWQAMYVRMGYDSYLRDMLQGKLYDKTIEEIDDWGGFSDMFPDEDREGFDYNKLGKHEQEFLQWYGRLRIKVIKDDKESDFDEYEELENEYIALIHLKTQTLCSLRVNKFPLQERPLDLDIFDPDDDGKLCGMGVVERMDGVQKAYDALFNQYVYGVMQSNNPFGFFTPFSNMRDEPLKIKNGNLYPTTDPKSVNIVQIPSPNASMQQILELIRYWAQLIYGISDYSAGVESQIDPSAPAKKAEIVVAQGNVRLNMIIKQRIKTFQKICRKWFLLYQANMPPNKFMRITGTSENNPWKFESVTLQDFALNSLPDFELTGNVLNMNKQLEAQKKLAIYNLMSQNFLFNPSTQQGLIAYNELTRWILEALDETGISRYLPKAPDVAVNTPEEENAIMLQGEDVEPSTKEDSVRHLQVHRAALVDPTYPEEVKTKYLIPHINKTIKVIQSAMLAQMVAERQGFGFKQPMGGQGGQPGQGAPAAAGNPVEAGAGLPGF